jgi:glycerate 2-kinase
LLVPDSFKECMTAREACEVMESGIKKVMPDAICVKVPIADGGEGTLHTLIETAGGKIYHKKVVGPLLEEVNAEYGILGDGRTGVVELATASGIQLVPRDKRNPLITTTFGTGQLIKEVLRRGVKELIIGVGGSATVDGGVGLAKALGIKFLDRQGKEIGFGGVELRKIEFIDVGGRIKTDAKIVVACDVTNSLTGVEGAAYVYGPQKGATKEMVNELDEGLEHLAVIVKQHTGKDVQFIPGSGAGGGIGASLLAFLDVEIKKGVEVVMEYSKVREKMRDADYVFAGEGKMDAQIIFGKAISGIMNLQAGIRSLLLVFAGGWLILSYYMLKD